MRSCGGARARRGRRPGGAGGGGGGGGAAGGGGPGAGRGAVARAAERWKVAAGDVRIADGLVVGSGGDPITIGDLVKDAPLKAVVGGDVAAKPPAARRG